jgi:hypothetical protein
VVDIVSNSVREELSEPSSLGSRIAARCVDLGLEDDIAERRGHPARPAQFES